LEITNKVATSSVFSNTGFGKNNTSQTVADAPITLSHIAYNTNDIWSLSAALEPHASHPFLLRGSYANGWLYILNIPHTPAQLYDLPAETLTLLRRELNLPVVLECGSRVGLFMYDNNTFIIQSFHRRPVRVGICFDAPRVSLEKLAGINDAEKIRSGDGESVFEAVLPPGRHAAFRVV
jgi:hypothetical protein